MTFNIDTLKLMVVRDSEPLGVVKTPQDSYEIIKQYIGNADREHFIVLLLNTKNNVTGLHTVSIGHLSASIVHPREVFKAAILGNAAKMMLAHNHPSGNPQPSQEDIVTTKRLCEAGELLGIEVIDHVIVGHENYYSFKQEGML